jgi:4-amino-4-deoxy-L-arabinose transferase-like glycosyltransferase
MRFAARAQVSDTRAVRARVAAVIAILPVLVALALQLDRPFGDGDEVLYAEGIREMRRGAGYGVLHWGGHEVLERPVAPFVIASLGTHVLADEPGLRLASLLAALATLAFVFVIARRAFGSAPAALAAVVVCGLTPSFHVFGTALISDPPFTLALIAAVGGALRAEDDPRGLVVAGVALGAAVALKSLAAGPALVVLLPWLVRAARRHRAGRAAAWGVAGFVALAAPFFVVGLIARGDRFVEEHLGRALVARAAGELHHLGMVGGPTAYARYLAEVDGPLVLGWILSGTVAALIGAVAWGDRRLALVASTALGFALVLSLIGTRLPHYLLPLYPLAALGLAGLLARLLAIAARRRRAPWPAAVVVAAALLVGGGAFARRDAEAHFMPDPAAVALGRVARAVVPAGQPIHALEWYAPALAYYADRPLRIVTASPGLYAIVDAVDYFHATGVPLRAPPAARGPIWLAGPRAAVAAAGWLAVDAELAAAEDHVLVRARVVE